MVKNNLYKKKLILKKKNNFFPYLSNSNLKFNIYFLQKYLNRVRSSYLKLKLRSYLFLVIVVQKKNCNYYFSFKKVLYNKKILKTKKYTRIFFGSMKKTQKTKKSIRNQIQLYNTLTHYKIFSSSLYHALRIWKKNIFYNNNLIYSFFYLYKFMKAYFFKFFERHIGNLFYKKTKNNFFLTITNIAYGVLYYSSIGRFLKGSLNIKKRRKSNISLKTLILLSRKHIMRNLLIKIFNKVFFFTQSRVILKYVRWIIYGLLYFGLYINELIYLIKKAHNGTRKKKKTIINRKYIYINRPIA